MALFDVNSTKKQSMEKIYMYKMKTDKHNYVNSKTGFHNSPILVV